MRCSSCDRENPPQATFCMSCGSKLEPTWLRRAARIATRAPSHRQVVSFVGAADIDNMRQIASAKRIDIHGTGTFDG